MEANVQGGGAEDPVMRVKTEAADESPSALSSQESPHAPCGDAACGAGGGGGGGQTAEELQAVATTPPVLLCEHMDLCNCIFIIY